MQPPTPNTKKTRQDKIWERSEKVSLLPLMLVTLYFHFTEYSGSHFHAVQVIFPKTHLELLAIQHHSNKVLWAESSLSSWRCMPRNQRTWVPFIPRKSIHPEELQDRKNWLCLLPLFPLSSSFSSLSLFFSLPLWSPKYILFSIFFLLLKTSKQYIYIFISFIYIWEYTPRRAGTERAGEEKKKNYMPCSSWE